MLPLTLCHSSGRVRCAALEQVIIKRRLRLGRDSCDPIIAQYQTNRCWDITHVTTDESVVDFQHVHISACAHTMTAVFEATHCAILMRFERDIHMMYTSTRALHQRDQLQMSMACTPFEPTCLVTCDATLLYCRFAKEKWSSGAHSWGIDAFTSMRH